jgi:hypothetical protein
MRREPCVTSGAVLSRADPTGFYDGITPRHVGRELVMAGPPVTFVAG